MLRLQNTDGTLNGKKLKNKEGFTLIEVIAILVILGLLAVFAIPKFFDLQDRARQKPINAAISDMMGRVNQRFAGQLLDVIIVASVDYSEGSVGTNLGQDFDITNWRWGLGSTQVSFDLTYYPNPDDHTLNPVTTSVVLDLPQTVE
jgi:prepilin-type N-terminal cleavage/methylation domain-containing protein